MSKANNNSSSTKPKLDPKHVYSVVYFLHIYEKNYCHLWSITKSISSKSKVSNDLKMFTLPYDTSQSIEQLQSLFHDADTVSFYELESKKSLFCVIFSSNRNRDAFFSTSHVVILSVYFLMLNVLLKRGNLDEITSKILSKYFKDNKYFSMFMNDFMKQQEEEALLLRRRQAMTMGETKSKKPIFLTLV